MMESKDKDMRLDLMEEENKKLVFNNEEIFKEYEKRITIVRTSTAKATEDLEDQVKSKLEELSYIAKNSEEKTAQFSKKVQAL
jgi:predicted site-specific integrase-resolvase